MSIDLTYPRQRVQELLMSDECIIDRRPLGTQGWTMNETTGDLTPPVGDSTKIYEGVCQVVHSAEGSPISQDLGLQTRLNGFTIRLPWSDGNDVELGDLVTVTVCNDPTLEGAHLRVLHVVRTSLAVSRDLICEKLETNRGS